MRKKITTKYNINPFADADLDGVPNWKDCKPFDPTKQDLVGDIKKAGSTVKKKVGDFLVEREQQKKAYEKKAESYSYVIALMNDGKWINLGAYSNDIIQQFVKTLEADPAIVDAVITDNPKEADKRNRAKMVEQVGSAAKRVGEAGRQFAVDQKLITQQNMSQQPRSPVMQRIKEGPSTRPPTSTGWWGNMDQQRQMQQQRVMQQQMPMQDIDYYQEPAIQQQRKVPPGAKRYSPVTKHQSFVLYKPVGRPLRRTSRPRGMMPIARIQFMKFGRRVRE